MNAISAEKLLACTVVLHEVSSHDELIPELPTRIKNLLGASKVAMVIVEVTPQGAELSRVTHAAGLGGMGNWPEAPTGTEGDWVTQLLNERRKEADASRSEPFVRISTDGRAQAVCQLNSEYFVAFDIQTAGAAFTITEQGKSWLGAMIEHLARNLRARLNRPNMITQQVTPLHELTKGEWRVLLAIDGDDQEKEIADKLSLSTHTVHSHIKQVYRVMGVRSRMGAIAMLHRAERLAMLQELMPRDNVRDLKVKGGCSAVMEADGVPTWAKRIPEQENSPTVRVMRPFDRLVNKSASVAIAAK